MHDQAVENWLFRIMRDAAHRYPEYHWTFYSALGRQGRLDEAVRELGGEVILAPVPVGNKARFVAALHNTLAHGGFDIMHAHHDIVSAVYLLSSLRTGVKRRIVHVHNTAMALPTPSSVKKAMMWEAMRQVVLRMSDRIAGISRDALASMILEAPPRPSRDVVVYYGIDTAKFSNPRRSREETRRAIEVAPDAKVILFAGRMTEYKNPSFVVDVLAQIERAMPGAIAVFAGTGPESENVSRRAVNLGLASRIRLLGWRDALAELMLAADLLLWPGQEEPREGFGLGILEAQAAGLPIVMSRSVPEDAVVVHELVSIIPLACGAPVWGREVFRRLTESHVSKAVALKRIEASHFSLAAGTDNLMALYADLPPR